MANLFDSSGSNMFDSSSTNIFGDIDNNKRLADRLKRESLLKSIIDGDTFGKARLVGIDSMESQNLGNGNERAQKIKDEYGISFEDQLKLGTLAKEELKKQIIEGNYDIDSIGLEQGRDVYGRRLIHNQDLQEKLLQSGLYAPTDRYDKKSQDLFRKAQEKTARVNAKQAEMMEAQRQYNILGQAPGILDRLGAPVDALQSGTQQLVAGTGDFLLDVLTPGNNTWLDEAKSAESADKNWGYDRKEAQFQQDELMDDWKQGNYGSALGTAALLAPEVIGESLPMMASMLTPTGLGRAAVAGVGAKALGATAKAAKAEGAIREANALSKFATSMTDDGFMLAVGTTTNNHIDEFTANNDGVGPSYGEIARMTAINALQLGTDKFAFQDIVGAGPLTGFVKAMKPMTKVVPDNVLGKIGVGVARTAMSMGEEAGQEYLQTWAEILNGQLGTTKYGSMQQILANEQNQDEALLGGILGAGAGGGMHIAAMPVNAIKNKMNKGREEIERADANRQELTRQILSGELDLDANPVSFSGEGKTAAQNDVVLLASHSDNKIGTELAIAAMNPDVSTIDAIRKVDASLRKAFNLGDNVAGVEAGLDTVINEVRYQDASFKIALKTLDKLSMVGTDEKANVDTSSQIAEVMDSYASILPPERLAQLHLNLLDRTIKSLQSAAMNDKANEGSTIAKSIGAAGESYKVSTEFMTKALSQLRASEASIMKGSYGGATSGTGNAGFGSQKDALEAISMFAAGLESKIKEAEKTGYAEFKGSPYDALKGTSQVASEILIKGKTGSNRIYGKGLIQHGIDISDDIAKAASSKNKTIKTANIKSFVDFAMQRFKQSKYKFTDSTKGKDFKSKFFPRTTIFGTEEETGLAEKRYLTNYHDQMDPSGNTAAQKKTEAMYMLDMIQRMIRLLVASKGQIEEKSYNDMMDSLKSVEAQQLADIKAADKIIAEKADSKDSDPMVAVSINKYLVPGRYIPVKMRELVQEFKDSMSKENIGKNQYYYVYVPLSYVSSGKSTGVSSAEEYYANNEIDVSESDDIAMYDENGEELIPSSGSKEKSDVIAEEPESETKAKVDENIDNKPEDSQIEPQAEGTENAGNETTAETNEPRGEGKTPDETPKSNESSEGIQEGNEKPEQRAEKPVTKKTSDDSAVYLENRSAYISEDELAKETDAVARTKKEEKRSKESQIDIMNVDYESWLTTVDIGSPKTIDDFYAAVFSIAEEEIAESNAQIINELESIAKEHNIDYGMNSSDNLKDFMSMDVAGHMKLFRSAATKLISALKADAKATLKASGSIERIGKLGQILTALVKDLSIDATSMLAAKAVVLKDGTDLRTAEIKEASDVIKVKSEATLRSNEDASERATIAKRIKRVEKRITELRSVRPIDEKSIARLYASIQKDILALQGKNKLASVNNSEVDTNEVQEKTPVQVKKTDKPAKFNMFKSLGNVKHDTKADIEAIDATIASLKEEEKALRNKRVEELVDIMRADSMKLGTQEGGMIFREDPAEEDKLRQEQRKKWYRAAHLQVNKEFRGCF